MTTTVANIRKLPHGWWNDPQFVYIGRRNGTYPSSPFCNPFPLADCGNNRNRCIERFIEWFNSQPGLIEQAKRELKDKTLVCWCAPKLCHGDYLAAVVDDREFSAGRFLF